MALTIPGGNTPVYSTTNFTAPSANPNFGTQYSVVPEVNLFNELHSTQGILYREPDGTVWIKYDNGSYQPLSDVLAVTTATESVRGVLEIATVQEVKDGLNASDAVTPATLRALLESFTFNSLLGNGVNNFFTFTHNFNTPFLLLNVIEMSTEKRINVDWNIPDFDSVIIGPFSFIPAINEFRVEIFAPSSY